VALQILFPPGARGVLRANSCKGQAIRSGTLGVRGVVYHPTAVETAIKDSSLTAEQLNKDTTLAAAKPMAVHTYKLDLARGLSVRTFHQG
jgi:hypothetical protein